MSKHTPGPWRLPVYKEIEQTTIEDAGGTLVAVASFRGGDGQWLHNARLIATAPELLAALRIALRQNEHDMVMTGEECRQCSAAIAKATGEEA